MELWKSLQFHTCCEPCNLFSPFVLHRTAAGFSYQSFVYPDWASIFNLGADSATEEPDTVPLFLKIRLDLLFHHLNIWLVSTTCYSFCTREKFQPFSFCAYFVFTLCARGCTSTVFTDLKAACLSLLLSSVIAGLPPIKMQGCTSWGLNFGVFDHSWVNDSCIFSLFGLSWESSAVLLWFHTLSIYSQARFQ